MTDPSTTSRPDPTRIGPTTFRWGERTFVMGILNVTPDSFSGDGLIDPAGAAADAIDRAVAQAERMVREGADIIDVGGQSTRPGHLPVSDADELQRVVGVVAAIRDRIADVPISIDTSKAQVAEAALAAGAGIVNDVAAVTSNAALAGLAAARGAVYVVMHDRARPEYDDVVGEVVADLGDALGQAQRSGCPIDRIIVDPGIGFGKTPEQNLELLRRLAALRELGRPILLGASRKSTIGKVLDRPVEDRLEGTLATTALGIASGVDIVRVHDVAANVRVARMSDAIVRGGWQDRRT